jgi:tRNA 2-thiouridine synthesizing protein A
MSTPLPIPKQTIDLSTAKCPLNFVKTKLALEKLATGDVLEVWIVSGSDSSLNIPQSIQQEGHTVLAIVSDDTNIQRIFIQKE